MPTRAITPTPKTYAQLRDAVFAVIVEGRHAIDRAWVDTSYETGRLINEHILLFRERADYGARVYEKLAADTKISVRTLRQCAQFHRCYPIRHRHAELIWSHYQLLIQVADPAKRKALEAEAVRKHWTPPELAERVRSYNAVALASDDPAPASLVELLKLRCGTPGWRRVVERPDGLGIDLGFKNYADLGSLSHAKILRNVDGSTIPSNVEGLKAGDLVQWDETGLRKIPDATPAQLFTYRATIRKVIDGDTLDVAITLAPGFSRDLKLRLRGIDCPEISTAAGRAAKTFVEKLLKPGDEVIICTSKPDKYDRYLADVFIGEARAQSSGSQPSALGSQLDSGSQLSALNSQPGADGTSSSQPSALDSQLGADGTVFLNNALLSARHAIRYDGGAKEE